MVGISAKSLFIDFGQLGWCCIYCSSYASPCQGSIWGRYLLIKGFNENLRIRRRSTGTGWYMIIYRVIQDYLQNDTGIWKGWYRVMYRVGWYRIMYRVLQDYLQSDKGLFTEWYRNMRRVIEDRVQGDTGLCTEWYRIMNRVIRDVCRMLNDFVQGDTGLFTG